MSRLPFTASGKGHEPHPEGLHLLEEGQLRPARELAQEITVFLCQQDGRNMPNITSCNRLGGHAQECNRVLSRLDRQSRRLDECLLLAHKAFGRIQRNLELLARTFQGRDEELYRSLKRFDESKGQMREQLQAALLLLQRDLGICRHLELRLEHTLLQAREAEMLEVELRAWNSELMLKTQRLDALLAPEPGGEGGWDCSRLLLQQAEMKELIATFRSLETDLQRLGRRAGELPSCSDAECATRELVSFIEGIPLFDEEKDESLLLLGNIGGLLDEAGQHLDRIDSCDTRESQGMRELISDSERSWRIVYQCANDTCEILQGSRKLVLWLLEETRSRLAGVALQPACAEAPVKGKLEELSRECGQLAGSLSLHQPTTDGGVTVVAEITPLPVTKRGGGVPGEITIFTWNEAQGDEP